MKELREYKPLALVFYIDGNGNRAALPLDDSKVSEFKRVIENTKMVELEWVTINTFEIKEIRPAYKTTEIEKFYYSRDPHERALIDKRVKGRVQNQRVNVIESLSELGTEKAINMMQRWIAPVEEDPIVAERVTTTQSNQITEQQKEEIKAKFKQLLSRYQTTTWKN